jgi:type IV pilus assembly protein PilY1
MAGKLTTSFAAVLYLVISVFCSGNPADAANSIDYQAVPPFVTAGVPPLVMLVMGRNHKLYYEAYNDASDLNDDGKLDVGYNPDIDYYGYFDSYKYYQYSFGNSRFEPRGTTMDKKVPSGNWSGDFLNYLTMTRMDCMRKVLYGGLRSTDTSTETVLERSFVPQDAHSWGKEYHSVAHDGYDIRDYTSLDLPKGGSHHLFASTTLSDGGDPLLRVLENSVFRVWEWVAIERPVAGSQGNDGSGRRAITDNNVSGGIFDITTGGSAGTADDSYTGGAGAGVIKTDDFNDGSLDSDWRTADHDTTSGTSFSESGGTLIIDAAGSDTWTGTDQFGAVYLDNISGDFDFKLKITQQERMNGWGKTGIMVRNDMTQAGSSTGYCMMCITPDNGRRMQWDGDNNGFLEGNSASGGAASPPEWVRLTKAGTVFSGYYGPDGTAWTLLRTVTLGSANAVQDVGIFVTSHSPGNNSECRFDNIELGANVAMPDPDFAFDDDTNTKWIYPDEPTAIDPVWIEFQFSAAKEIKSYSINAGNDAPEDWKFQGSNDRVSWDTLDTVSNAGLTSGTSKTYDTVGAGVYQYYRLLITDTSDSGSNGLSIAEIQLMETTDPIPATATLTDYEVRVKVGDPSIGVEPNSKLYPSGAYKPIGILQRHGESDRMYFGLVTGSYTKNTSGGVLRKNIRSIRDEINASTGEFLYMDSASVNGILKTIDKFRIVDFDYGSKSYNANCGWITGRPLNEGECRMWGNPVSEMMYESLRYFAGKGSPTAEFTYGTSVGLDDNELGLPKPGWLDPYTDSEDINLNGSLDAGEDLNGNGTLDGFDYCAKPFMLVLSDINPTYDSDQLPGSAFGSVSSTLAGLDVEALANTISTTEGDIGTHFIGQAVSYDGACTPKAIPGFGTIRGLCPEEPTKGGSYYSASVAYHGNKEDLHTILQDQEVSTYCVGLASPLPRIEINVGTGHITMVPFAKSVGGSGISASSGSFQPTNTIVDFFVEEVSPTRGKFRINYEDVEQGADHDMDAIVEYVYQVVDASDNPVADPAQGQKVIISLNSTYAAGGIIQHMGYIISGTTNDGTFLEVRDVDTGAGSDPDYFLDTPPNIDPGGAWNDGTALPLTSTRIFFPGASSAATLLKTPLWYAAKWGGFEDYNNNDIPDLANEWDKDSDGIPDTYFYVQNPLRLEEQLNRSFADILRRTASGTAASVISQTRSGEGAVYQAVFYPEFKGPLGNTVNWAGEIHSLLVDNQGNMREDTNLNDRLDTDPLLGDTDRMIVFDGTTIYKYLDSEGDGIIEEGQAAEFTGGVDDIKYLWSSSTWLNEMSDAEAASQRIYNTSSNNRYIFTFVDNDNDMVVDPGEQVEFESSALPLSSQLTDPSTIFPYLTLFPTFSNEPSIVYNGASVAMNTFRGDTAQFEDFLKNQSSRVVNYIRGIDQTSFTSSTTPSYIIPEFRSREIDYDDDGIHETWRLGDIVYSTPTEVGRPSENYHMIYRDHSYETFAASFINRRHVIYAGANDGMFHAFNAGFYEPSNYSFVKELNGETEHDLGSELWAYVPYNLLPHLYWLTETNYPHVYFCDLKPKIFDAKVFPDETHYTDTDTDPNWGTLIVAGMRFGGGQITADMDKTDGNTVNAGVDRTMSSAFFILDVTDPESVPKVIAEISFKGLGYTTCYPTVIPMKDKDAFGTINENEWYLVFGSGPASSTGVADINGASGVLEGSISKQTGKLFVVNLKELVLNGTLKTLDSAGVFTSSPATGALHDYYEEIDPDSFISDPISVDYNLDYSADAVYFGTVSGDSVTGWGGKLRRIVIENDIDYGNWDGDSILMDLDPVHSGQPVTTAPTIGQEYNGTRWIFWGTGRFSVRTDAANADMQTYYGIQEPFTFVDDSNGDNKLDRGETVSWTWGNVLKSDLVDVTNAVVYDDKRVENVTSITDWDDLLDKIDDNASRGWYMDFTNAKERNLGQATLLAELLTFTTYIPSDDICSFEGQSNLYGLYYKTGTAYFKSVIGTIHHDIDGNTEVDEGELEIKKTVSLGQGLAVTPNIHVGREKGSKAFVQTSTGAIEVVEQINPGMTKSGVTSWQEIE